MNDKFYSDAERYSSNMEKSVKQLEDLAMNLRRTAPTPNELLSSVATKNIGEDTIVKEWINPNRVTHLGDVSDDGTISFTPVDTVDEIQLDPPANVYTDEVAQELPTPLPTKVKTSKPVIKITKDRFSKQFKSVFNSYNFDIKAESGKQDISNLKIIEFNTDLIVPVDDEATNKEIRLNIVNLIDLLKSTVMSNDSKTAYMFTELNNDDNKFITANDWTVYTTEDGVQVAVYIKERYENHRVVKLSNKDIKHYLKLAKKGGNVTDAISEKYMAGITKTKSERVLSHLIFNVAILVNGDKNE